MSFIEESRHRVFRRRDNGKVEDTNFDLVKYPEEGEFYEPADTILPRGFNGTGKQYNGIVYVDERNSGAPLNSNVTYPRTGTAAS